MSIVDLYLAIDKDSREFIYKGGKPKRGKDSWIPEGCCVTFIELPKNTIKKILGKDLTWKDEPFELK